MFGLKLTERNGACLLNAGFAGEKEKPLIPPFESEQLKIEKKSGENNNRRLGKEQILLVWGFFAFESAIFALCFYLPE